MACARLKRWRRAGSALLLALACSQPVLAQDSPATLTVGAGDTATALALQMRPEGATLEQTLVALWRANPRAFGNGNLNQLLQGATLKVPSLQEILRTPAAQAREQVVEQVENFQAYARQQGKTATAASPAAAAGPDAAQWARALAEARALREALERQSRDTQSQLAQLEKNIQALQSLQAAAASPAQAASAADSPASEPAAAASEPASAPDHAAASEPVAAAAPPTLPEMLASLPPLVWAGGALLLLLIVWLVLRKRQSPAPAPQVAIPPQMARISLDLDSPPAAAPGGQDPRP